MFAQIEIQPKELIMVKLEASSQDFQVIPSALKSDDTLETDQVSLKFDKAVAKDSKLSFTLTDKKTDSEEQFSFGLNYWPAYVDYHQSHNSGAYDFRPLDHMFANIPYSQLKNAFFYKGLNMQKMVFYFENNRKRTKEVYEKATVHVTLDQDFHVSRFDVELDSIPGSGVDGFELTPTFDALNLDNNQTFYTDSNGLEM